MRFEVSGRQYEIDIVPEQMMGDELLLIEDHLGGVTLTEAAAQLAAGRFGMRLILVLTYLAARRQGETRPWSDFVRTVAPLTFRLVDEPTAPPPAAPSRVDVQLPVVSDPAVV